MEIEIHSPCLATKLMDWVMASLSGQHRFIQLSISDVWQQHRVADNSYNRLSDRFVTRNERRCSWCSANDQSTCPSLIVGWHVLLIILQLTGAASYVDSFCRRISAVCVFLEAESSEFGDQITEIELKW